MLAVGLVAVLLPLIEGREHGWPLWTWISFVVAADLLVLFVLHQRRLGRRGGDPVLDLTLFRERAFSAGLVAHLLLACAQASFFVYFALFLQQGRGLAPLEAGLVFSILAVAYVATTGPAPQLAARFGRSVVVAGGAALAGGLGLLALAIAEEGIGGSLLTLVPGMLLVGAGIGLCYTSLTSTVLSHVHQERAGTASGALSTTQQVGYALGVAVTGLLFFDEAADGIAQAFEVSLLQLSVLGLGIVAATRFLPRTTGVEETASEAVAVAVDVAA
jgi:predicted MFS family arabinose efflux permease